MGVRLGNGNWGVKASKLLAYNDASGMFFNKEFDFTRATTATRVNKSGLIESVAANVPRIDFTDDTKGHLLLENSATNVSKNSENTSTWTYVEFGSGSAGTITTGKTDMFGGTNAVQVDFPADAENVAIRFGQTTSSITSGSATISIYAKLVQSGSKTLRFRASSSQNLVVDSTEFVRYEATVTKSSGEAFSLKLRPSQGTSNGGFSIILCQPQEEAGSFATSYIPCTGSDVTRNAEVCNSSGAAQDFNSTEGVLYVEFAALANEGTTRSISLSDGTQNNRLLIGPHSADNGCLVNIKTGNVLQVSENIVLSTITDFNKVAVRYKANDVDVFRNGELAASDNSVSLASINTFNSLQFDSGAGFSDFSGKIREVRTYRTALTDAELIALTT